MSAQALRVTDEMWAEAKVARYVIARLGTVDERWYWNGLKQSITESVQLMITTYEESLRFSPSPVDTTLIKFATELGPLLMDTTEAEYDTDRSEGGWWVLLFCLTHHIRKECGRRSEPDECFELLPVSHRMAFGKPSADRER